MVRCSFRISHTPAYSESDPAGGGFGLSYAAMNATDVRTEIGNRSDAPVDALRWTLRAKFDGEFASG